MTRAALAACSMSMPSAASHKQNTPEMNDDIEEKRVSFLKNKFKTKLLP